MNAQTLKTKKITMATLKSFINKSAVLFAKQDSSFDGMNDCVMPTGDVLTEVSKENAIGFKGVYCVGSGRDYFEYKETETMYGINVFNSCGSGTLWTNK